MKGAAQCGGVVVESKLQPTIDAPCTSAGTVTVCSQERGHHFPGPAAHHDDLTLWLAPQSSEPRAWWPLTSVVAWVGTRRPVAGILPAETARRSSG
jgi:hypothetical protein